MRAYVTLLFRSMLILLVHRCMGSHIDLCIEMFHSEWIRVDDMMTSECHTNISTSTTTIPTTSQIQLAKWMEQTTTTTTKQQSRHCVWIASLFARSVLFNNYLYDFCCCRVIVVVVVWTSFILCTFLTIWWCFFVALSTVCQFDKRSILDPLWMDFQLEKKWGRPI